LYFVPIHFFKEDGRMKDTF